MFGTSPTLTWHIAKLGWVGHKSHLAKAQVSVPCLPKCFDRQYSFHWGEGQHQNELLLKYLFALMLQHVWYQKRKEKLTVIVAAVVVATILANSLGLAKQDLGQCQDLQPGQVG